MSEFGLKFLVPHVNIPFLGGFHTDRVGRDDVTTGKSSFGAR